MKRLAVFLFFIAAAAVAQQHRFTTDDLMAIRRVGAPQVSPKGNWVGYDVSTIDVKANSRKSTIYLIPAAGGSAKPITDGTKQDEGPVWSPDGKTIAFTSNRDGGAHQVWLFDVASGQSRKISNLTGGAGSVKWLPDGSGVLVVSDIYPECGVDPACAKDKTAAEAAAPSQARVITSLLYRHWKSWQPATRTHIVLQPLTGAPRDLTPGAFDTPPFSLGGGDEFDVSPDGKELVFARNTDEHPELSTNADLFLVAMNGTGEARRITTRTGADTSPKYSPDGRWIAYRSQGRAGYESDLWELWLYDRASGASRRIAGSFNDWIESISWAPDSKSIYFGAPQRGREALFEVSIPSGDPKMIVPSAVSSLAVGPDGKTLYFSSSTLSRPAEIHMVTKSAKGAVGPVVPLTHENDALLSQIRMPEATDFTWKGAGDTPVQGWLIKPPDFDPARKYPVVVLIHGGPQGAWTDAWGYRWNPQVFAAKDYVILMPNPRGSSGFGQQFVEEISGDWGGKAYTDIMNGVEALAAQPYVDGTRIGAAGGSYGGYMVDWILGHTDRFKALVSHAGVYDLESMYGVTEELWFPEFEFRGNPWDNPELYEKWSPHRYVKNFKTPTLVSHGELDFRVPINQGLELYTALQRRGVPSKLLYYPDEGHWVLKPQNSLLWYRTVGDWFDQWLKK